MPNSFFQFREFRIEQGNCAMKVSTEACILGAWADAGKSKKILDIGAGSGLLSLMLAQRSKATIDAVEIDLSAYLQCRNNFEKSPWKDRLHIFHKPVQEHVTDYGYDLIISNPPFFLNHQLSHVQSKNKAKHANELQFEDLWSSVNRLLSDTGRFCVLFPEKESVLFEEEGGKWNFKKAGQLIIKNKSRGRIFRIASYYSKRVDYVTDDTLAIRKENGDYSNEFKKLLRPYYLYL